MVNQMVKSMQRALRLVIHQQNTTTTSATESKELNNQFIRYILSRHSIFELSVIPNNTGMTVTFKQGCAHGAQTSAKVLIEHKPPPRCSYSTNLHQGPGCLTSIKSDLGFEFRFPDYSGLGSICLPDCSQNVVDSVSFWRQLFRRVLWKSAGD